MSSLSGLAGKRGAYLPAPKKAGRAQSFGCAKNQTLNKNQEQIGSPFIAGLADNYGRWEGSFVPWSFLSRVKFPLPSSSVTSIEPRDSSEMPIPFPFSAFMHRLCGIVHGSLDAFPHRETVHGYTTEFYPTTRFGTWYRNGLRSNSHHGCSCQPFTLHGHRMVST